jgi:hypothetical protein
VPVDVIRVSFWMEILINSQPQAYATGAAERKFKIPMEVIGISGL